MMSPSEYNATTVTITPKSDGKIECKELSKKKVHALTMEEILAEMNHISREVKDIKGYCFAIAIVTIATMFSCMMLVFCVWHFC